MIKRAIVRPPGTNFNRCLSTHPLHHTLNYELALEQHERYCNTLRDLGLDLIKLEPDNEHPDACFVEDTVVVFGDRAMITRMAKESRRDESEQVEEVLSEYKKISSVSAPGTLEGGDVIHLPDSLICGLTKRTNREGVSQMEAWLKTPVHCIEDPNIMHIKSHVTYLDRDTVIINPKYEGDPVLERFTKLLLPPKESHSANTLTVNDVVIMSHRHTQSAQLVKEAGFEVVQLNLSEFAKCDGALTCLSIIF
ncbi:MAG: arginine deiminase family protein [Candidatus Thorarchaeota archaeon]